MVNASSLTSSKTHFIFKFLNVNIVDDRSAGPSKDKDLPRRSIPRKNGQILGNETGKYLFLKTRATSIHRLGLNMKLAGRDIPRLGLKRYILYLFSWNSLPSSTDFSIPGNIRCIVYRLDFNPVEAVLAVNSNLGDNCQ